jgi:hypothetical protein
MPGNVVSAPSARVAAAMRPSRRPAAARYQLRTVVIYGGDESPPFHRRIRACAFVQFDDLSFFLGGVAGEVSHLRRSRTVIPALPSFPTLPGWALLRQGFGGRCERLARFLTPPFRVGLTCAAPLALAR